MSIVYIRREQRVRELIGFLKAVTYLVFYVLQFVTT